MSILGIKDWYLQDNNDTALTASPESDLVLTRYPIAFVQEARQKLRGGFFGSADLVYEEVNSTGTLLPFSDKSVGQRRIASDSSLGGSEDHPSVATWIIQPNGAVFLPEVGIVAEHPKRSTRQELWAQGIVPSGAPNVPKPSSDVQEAELNEWLASFSPEVDRGCLSVPTRTISAR